MAGVPGPSAQNGGPSIAPHDKPVLHRPQDTTPHHTNHTSTPGRDGSIWEDAVLSIMLTFRHRMEPPRCKVIGGSPGAMMHPNYFMSGHISLPVLSAAHDWHPLVTVRELLLKIQGQPQDAQKPQKRRQGPGPTGAGPGPGPGPRPRPRLLCFLSIRTLPMDLQHMNYGSQAADFEKISIMRRVRNRSDSAHRRKKRSLMGKETTKDVPHLKSLRGVPIPQIP